MTNEEIWKLQQARRAHAAAAPEALKLARECVIDWNGAQMADGEPPRELLTVGHIRTLVREIERLQGALKQANQDLRTRATVTQAQIDAAREAINEAATTPGAIYSDRIIRAALEAALGVQTDTLPAPLQMQHVATLSVWNDGKRHEDVEWERLRHELPCGEYRLFTAVVDGVDQRVAAGVKGNGNG